MSHDPSCHVPLLGDGGDGNQNANGHDSNGSNCSNGSNGNGSREAWSSSEFAVFDGVPGLEGVSSSSRSGADGQEAPIGDGSGGAVGLGPGGYSSSPRAEPQELVPVYGSWTAHSNGTCSWVAPCTSMYHVTCPANVIQYPTRYEIITCGINRQWQLLL